MLSQTTEYALRAVAHLAAQSGDPSPTTQQISQATQVPGDYLAKVLQALSRAGIVRSRRGRGGGHQLTRDPAKLTVLEVVNAVDPLPRIQSCPLGLKHHIELCPLHRRLDNVAALVEDSFRQTTIAELTPDTARPNRRACQFACRPTAKARKAALASR
ncbi:MAG: Rrf2 family transcriptional regulator [Pirellulales bacterium]|nr:Rrf2 family transcriptional regulator [Pirellulales bacterium]